MQPTIILLIISVNTAFHKAMSFMGFYFAIAFPTLLTSLFTSWFIDNNIFVSPTFWGLMGGICRWLQGRQKFTEGISSVIVGGISSTALAGSKIPFLDSIIQTSPEAAATVNAFLIGFIAMVMLGFLLDILQGMMKKKLNGKE